MCRFTRSSGERPVTQNGCDPFGVVSQLLSKAPVSRTGAARRAAAPIREASRSARRPLAASPEVVPRAVGVQRHARVERVNRAAGGAVRTPALVESGGRALRARQSPFGGRAAADSG